MTKELSFVFDHSAENFNDALGMSKEMCDHCREIVYFSAFSNHLLGNELFPDENERPKVLSTMTGDLQKCLQLVKTEEEAQFLLLIFMKTHDLAMETISKYSQLNECNPIEKREMKIMFEKIEILMEKKRNEGDSFISPIHVMNKINLVKKSRYNFDKYLEIVKEENSRSFDNILLKVFSNEQE